MDLYPDAQAMLEACAEELGMTPERVASHIIRKVLLPYTTVEKVRVTNASGLRNSISPF